MIALAAFQNSLQPIGTELKNTSGLVTIKQFSQHFIGVQKKRFFT
jgi:hypothetical protein